VRVASVRHPGVPSAELSCFQPSPTDPQQGMAKPLSQGGGTLGKACLRKGKMLHSSAKSGYINVRNSYADTKVRKERGGGGAPGTRAEIPLQPLEETIVTQVVPLQPKEWTMLEQRHTLQSLD